MIGQGKSKNKDQQKREEMEKKQEIEGYIRVVESFLIKNEEKIPRWIEMFL